jgi:hypothetical protein
MNSYPHTIKLSLLLLCALSLSTCHKPEIVGTPETVVDNMLSFAYLDKAGQAGAIINKIV